MAIFRLALAPALVTASSRFNSTSLGTFALPRIAIANSN
jgi:hypothetical protein